MSGYVVQAVLSGGTPRLVASAACIAAEMDGASGASRIVPADGASIERDLIELVGRPFGDGLAARWADLCEAWSQTTFFLFDPESWR